MYTGILHTHSMLRWVLLILLLLCMILGWSGMIRKSPWSPKMRKLQAALVGTFHLQFVLGLVLYMGLSPMMAGIFEDFGGAMKSPVLRFWGVEHITLMFLALVVAQATSISVKRAEINAKRWRRMALGYTLSMILVFGAIPWPFREHIGRSLLPF